MIVENVSVPLVYSDPSHVPCMNIPRSLRPTIPSYHSRTPSFYKDSLSFNIIAPHPPMRRNTQPATIRPSIRRITIIPRIIMTHLSLIGTRKPCKSTTQFILDAYSQRVTRQAATRGVRVCDAYIASLALVQVYAESAADLMRVGW
jgi:hypothetical protein